MHQKHKHSTFYSFLQAISRTMTSGQVTCGHFRPHDVNSYHVTLTSSMLQRCGT